LGCCLWSALQSHPLLWTSGATPEANLAETAVGNLKLVLANGACQGDY
jgi:hypothetical protein